MSSKPAKRTWNDVQTAIATAAIVTTLGMWNLFAAPAETATAQTEEPTLPPTEPPTETPTSLPTALPYVKVMFTPSAPLPTTMSPQTQPQQQAQQKKKKREKRRSGGGGGGGGTVTNTQTS